jgi:acyl-CoA reductase-like NAD-dependent aldehyde dehydrogenase
MAIGQKMMPGDPLDPKTQMGAIVDETQTKRVMGYIDVGQKEGAKLRMGGKQVHVDNAGYFVEPTVFDNVDNKMRIAREEIFGPVLSVIPVKDADQALTVANDTIYGLASAIFTADINKAFKFAKGLRAGSVWVNTYDGGESPRRSAATSSPASAATSPCTPSTSSPRSRRPGFNSGKAQSTHQLASS